MNKNSRRNQAELGQTAVLFALMLIGLILFVGLAVDGGNVFNERRITQNAADASALTGVHYIIGSDAPNETRLLEVVNGVVEANGVPDSDGISENAVNDNVTIFYTNNRGIRLTDEICCTISEDPDNPVPVPLTVQGLEVVVANPARTFFLSLIDRETVQVAANAVAVVRGGTEGSTLAGENALNAFGETCTAGEKPLDFSGYYIDVIGGVHGGRFFENRGSENHYHGQVTYSEGFIDTADIPGVYEPAPAQADAIGDPLARLELTVERFDCTSGDIGGADGITCYDLTQYAPNYTHPQNYPDGVVNYRLLTQNPPGEAPFLDEDTGQLREGLYYAGNYPIVFGWEAPEPEEGEVVGLHGNVTFVTNSFIKITENDVQLTGYMPGDSRIPGLLLYSGLNMIDNGKACTNHEDLTDWERPINTTGNAGTVPPKVYHAEERAGCVNLNNPAACYELGSLHYIGLIYAPGGRVAVSGHGASYVGGIIAYSIRVNGYVPYDDMYNCGSASNPCRPIVAPQVGALFVRDSNLIPPTDQLIYLDR